VFFLPILFAAEDELKSSSRDVLHNKAEKVDVEYSGAERCFLDGTAAIRIGSSGLTPVYYSDAWFLNPFGMEKKLEDIIIQSFWIAFGEERGLKVVNNESAREYSEQYFDMLHEQKNISKKEIEEMAKKNGFTLADISRELNKNFLMQQTVESYFTANGFLNVTRQEIIDYYAYLESLDRTKYTLKKGELKLSDDYDKEVMQKNYEAYIKAHELEVDWSKPYTVSYEDLNSNFDSILESDCGSIVFIDFLSNKMVFYELESRSTEELRSFNAMYEEIQKIIQARKYQEQMVFATKKFLTSDDILYDSQKIRDRCVGSLGK
jgi:hypothetical protein